MSSVRFVNALSLPGSVRAWLAVAGLVASCGLATGPTDAAADERVLTVDEARAAMAADYVGSPPLFYTQAAIDAAGLSVISVSLTTGAAPGATVFYRPIDGGEYNGQLWMSVSVPPPDVPGSFGTGSCGDRPILGPQQVGPLTAWLFECDISRIVRFNFLDRGYTSAAKYYGGLTADGLLRVTAAMTPVAVGFRAPAASPKPARATGRRARARKRCRRIKSRQRRAACIRRANRLPR